MTVQEVIEELKKYRPDQEVRVWAGTVSDVTIDDVYASCNAVYEDSVGAVCIDCFGERK